MAYNRAQAQKLCNESELQLVIASMADEVVKLTAAQLRSKVARARTLRDKNTDLFRRQSAAIRAATSAKRGSTGVANQRTEQKARLFDETLKRLETRLNKLESAAAKDAAKLAPKVTVARKSPTQAAVPKAPAKPAAPKKSVVRRAAAKAAPKVAVKAAPKAAVKAAPKAAAKNALKPAGKTLNVQAAVKAAVKKPAAKVAPAKVAQAAVAKKPVASGQRPAAVVSKTVAVRAKNIGAHARSSNARDQAKRAGR